MAEWDAMDQQWYEEVRTAVTYYRQGQAARKQADERQAEIRAG